MIAPPKWWTFQTPEFEEYTYIIKGKNNLVLKGNYNTRSRPIDTYWKQHSRAILESFDEPCEYIAICKPAFDFNKVHRED
jgi:hypothetical protein